MSTRAAELLGKLHPVDPYAGFPYKDYPLDLQGGPEDSTLAGLIAEMRPGLVIEVGCWKGATAVALATQLRSKARTRPSSASIPGLALSSTGKAACATGTFGRT
jgi:hypothetical protein